MHTVFGQVPSAATSVPHSVQPAAVAPEPALAQVRQRDGVPVAQ